MSEKSDETHVAVDNASFGGSTRTLVRKDWKKKLSNDLWWKITITLAVVIIAGFVIYKAVDDNKKSSTKTNLSSNSLKSTEQSILHCEEGSTKNSRAVFTYQPLNSVKPYTTHGLEFSFDNIVTKPGIESGLKELDEATAATAKIHYYYNIARCRIGGGVQLDKQPYIRGPIVFAVDQQCSKVYYFTEDKGWTQYSSARNINCSAHGKEHIEVDESKCLEGSIKDSNSSFVYVPYGTTKPYRANGVEFSFEVIANKTKLGSRLTKLNKLIASTSEIHYYYNIPRCRIGGGVQIDKQPYIRGPIVFAVDQQCSKVYYFTEGKGWTKYGSARNATCTSHGTNNETRCFKGSFDGSYFTFRFISRSGRVYVTGIQYNFPQLVGKLQDLTTDYNLTKIPEMTLAGQGTVSYYLNRERCYNGGPADLNANPPIRGAIIFAINGDCSSVYYLSSSTYTWIPYKSASLITCVNRHI